MMLRVSDLKMGTRVIPRRISESEMRALILTSKTALESFLLSAGVIFASSSGPLS